MSDETKQFEDPLEDYSPPDFDDRVEEAVHNKDVAEIQTQPHLCVAPDTSVREAMSLMVGHQIACVLVEDDEQLVGIFADRDVLDKVALEYDTVIDGPVSAVMTTDPVSVLEADPVAKVLAVMALSGYRHVPVVSPAGKAVGIVSPHRVGDFLQEYLQQAS